MDTYPAGVTRPDVVNLEDFDAEHTMSWKSDCERWRAVISSWRTSLVAF
ncbi:MAG: hypothetical protein LH475_03270 [Cryobacterium sp.]|nr:MULTISPECIES: hypothetical protein [unclassified Cryobacterium]MCY7403644.1 hypothetical protein [Cryobacterium sp.]MEC5155631.1 hypothetical protein [Cryobacterium sp. CAN_C3]